MESVNEGIVQRVSAVRTAIHNSSCYQSPRATCSDLANMRGVNTLVPRSALLGSGTKKMQASTYQDIVDYICQNYDLLKQVLQPLRERRDSEAADHSSAFFFGEEIERQFCRRAKQAIVEEVTKALPVSALDAILVVEDLDLALFS